MVRFAGREVVFEGHTVDELKAPEVRNDYAKLRRALAAYRAREGCASACELELRVVPNQPFAHVAQIVLVAQSERFATVRLEQDGDVARVNLLEKPAGATSTISEGDGNVLVIEMRENGTEVLGVAVHGEVVYGPELLPLDASGDALMAVARRVCGNIPCAKVFLDAQSREDARAAVMMLSAASLGGRHAPQLVLAQHDIEQQRWNYGRPELPSGSLPPQLVQLLVRNQFARLRSCYDAGLRRQPSLRGRVTVRFHVGTDGRVTHAESVAARTSVRDVPVQPTTLRDPAAVSCMLEVFRSLQLTRPKGTDVTAIYPILFQPD